MTIAANAPTQVVATQGGSGAAVPGAPGGPARPPGTRTDRRLVRLRAALAAGALLFGAAGIIGTQIRADGADDAKAHSGVMTCR